MTASQLKSQDFPFRLLLVLLVMTIGIGFSGYLSYFYQEEHIRQEKRDSLSAVAALKVNEIAHWRKERIGDATVILENPLIAQRLEAWLRTPLQSAEEQDILLWLMSLKKHYDYKNILLLDGGGSVRLSVPSGRAAEPRLLKMLPAVLQQKKPVLLDPHRSEVSDDILCCLLVPLYSTETRGQAAFGVLVLQIDPYQFLYPLIRWWPTPSRSSETLLVRREGNEVMFLSEFRQQKHNAPLLRLPMDDPRWTEAMAVAGRQGIVEGIDYRDVPVLAAIRAIPESPWFLIAKIDLEEINAPIRERAWLTVLFVGLLVAGAGVSIGFFWSRQHARFYRQQYESEAARLEMAKRYEYFTKYANDIIVLADREGSIVEVNERAVSSYGYARDELLRLNVRNLRAAETLKDLDAQWRQVAEQSGHVFETMHRRKDGTAFPVEESSRIINLSGTDFYWSTVRDTSERKRAEQALRVKDSAIESSINAIAISDLQGYLTYANASFVRLWGYQDGAEVLGRSVLEFWEESRQAQDVIRALRQEGSWVGELLARSRQGSVFSVQLAANMVRDETGQPICMMASFIDITERKRTEEALLESERRFREMLENVQLVAVMLDVQGNVTFCNDFLLELTGWKREEICGRNWFDLFIPPELGVKQVFEEAIGGGYIPLHHENDILTRQGERRHISWNNTVLRDLRGNIIGTTSIGEDITERKRARRLLERAYEELERRVRERTADLSKLNDQLKQEIDVRIEVERALRDSEKQLRFLSSQLLSVQENERKRIAVELHDSTGQVLTAIKFGLENAVHQIKGEALAVKTLESLIHMVQNAIEDVRRIYTNLRPSLLDDLGILATISWFCREFAEHHPGISIEKKIKINESDVPVDLKIVIYRVMQEAFHNIAKYSGAKLVDLSLSKNVGLIELSIEDDGEGFDVEEALTRRNSKGGLGLASMKERIEFSGGSFSITSAPSKGTIVHATWPSEK